MGGYKKISKLVGALRADPPLISPYNMYIKLGPFHFIHLERYSFPFHINYMHNALRSEKKYDLEISNYQVIAYLMAFF